ncbi:hypothetical protein ACT7DA_24490 [Bacillus pacificus]
MKDRLRAFLQDLEAIGLSSQKDYNESKYFSYNLYLEQYNEVLSELHKLGYFTDKHLIMEVPSNQRTRGVLRKK